MGRPPTALARTPPEAEQFPGRGSAVAGKTLPARAWAGSTSVRKVSSEIFLIACHSTPSDRTYSK